MSSIDEVTLIIPLLQYCYEFLKKPVFKPLFECFRMTVNHDVTGSSPVGGAIKQYTKCTAFLFGSMSIVGANPKKRIA